VTLHPEWVTCPLCNASVELVEQTSDTLTEQAHVWRCAEGHEGVMTWTITAHVEHARPKRSDPITPRRFVAVAR